MKPASLRSRLLLLLIAGATVTTLIGGLIVDAVVRHRLAADFDRTLVEKARAFVSLTMQGEHGVELEFADEFMPEFHDRRAPQYFELRLADGTLVERSHSFGRAGVAPGAGLPRDGRPSTGPRLSDVKLPDGRPGRLVQIDFVVQMDEPEDDLEDDADEDDETGEDEEESDPEDGSLDPTGEAAHGRTVASVLIARESDSLARRLFGLRLVMLCTGAAIVLAVAGLSSAALALGLRPLGRLAREVEALDARQLGSRLEAGSVPSELRPVAEQVNGLLERIEAALARERQLTSDIAHDLKTPVAELRAACDVASRWPEDRDAATRFFRDAREIALTLQRTIDGLLALARHDAGRQVVNPSSFDLRDLVTASWSAFAGPAEARGLRLATRWSGPVPVHADRERLGQVLANLLENAVAHSVEGTTITCEISGGGPRGAVLTLANRAADLEPEDIAHVFERFWRKESARTDRSHAGLGLALARANADLLGLGLEARLDDGDVFTVVLTVPRRSDDAGLRQVPAADPAPSLGRAVSGG